jgi:low temperature requirement protein LtrA
MPLIRPVRLRASEEAGRRVTWLELFFDLAFVAAVSQVGASLAEHYSAGGLVRYGLLLGLIWWAWLGHTVYATRFDTDDLVQRLLTLTQIFGVAVMAINAGDDLASRDSAGFAAAYAGLRFVLVFEYIRARHVRRARPYATSMAAALTVAASLWLASAMTPAPARFWLWAIALTVDVLTPLMTSRFAAEIPPHPEHLPERFGLFTIILLGETLVSVMRGMKTQDDWSVAAASSALLGMVMAFTLWWWYFDGVEAAGTRHVHSRQDTWKFNVWAYAHLPLYLGIGIAGIGAEHVIKIAPTQPLDASEAWMLCGGLALAMVSVTTIASIRTEKDVHPRSPSMLAAHCAIAAAALLLGVVGSSIHAAVFLIALVILAVMQLVISLASVAKRHAAFEVVVEARM